MNIFTDAQEKAICLQYRNGKNILQLGKEHSVHYGTINRILVRQGEPRRSRSVAHRKYEIDDAVFDDAVNNAEAAYWVGFLMADLSLNKDKTGYSFALSLGVVDEAHVCKFRDFLKSNHPIVYLPPGPSMKSPTGQSRLYVANTPLCHALMKYGVVPNKTYSAKVIGLENSAPFWRGCVDGDGWVTLPDGYPEIGLCGHVDLLEQFKTYALSVVPDMEADVLHTHEHNWRLSTHGLRAQKLISALQYDKDVPCLARKKGAAEVCLRWEKKFNHIPKDQYPEIARLHGLGYTTNRLAIMYKVSHPAMYQTLKRLGIEVVYRRESRITDDYCF